MNPPTETIAELAAEVERLAKQATERDWSFRTYEGRARVTRVWVDEEQRRHTACVAACESTTLPNTENAAYIVTACNAAPRLAAAWREAEAYAKELEAENRQLRDALSIADQQRDEAKKDAESWKRHWEMYRDAWVRELGGWVIPKHHEIDSLVFTTRKRCVNPLLGNCSTPHWLGAPTADRKGLQQTPHPNDASCRDWKVDDSEPRAALAPSEKEESR